MGTRSKRNIDKLVQQSISFALIKRYRFRVRHFVSVKNVRCILLSLWSVAVLSTRLIPYPIDTGPIYLTDRPTDWLTNWRCDRFTHRRTDKQTDKQFNRMLQCSLLWPLHPTKLIMPQKLFTTAQIESFIDDRWTKDWLTARNRSPATDMRT